MNPTFQTKSTKPKYKPGDNVWIVWDEEKIIQIKIQSVDYEIKNGQLDRFFYVFQIFPPQWEARMEHHLFNTPEEALESLRKQYETV
jgi:hypothetical protein